MATKLTGGLPGMSRAQGIVLLIFVVMAGHFALGALGRLFNVGDGDFHFLEKSVFLGMTVLAPGFGGIALTLAKAARYGQDRMDPFILLFAVCALVVVAYTVALLADTLAIFTDLAAEGLFVGVITTIFAVIAAVVAGRNPDEKGEAKANE